MCVEMIEMCVYIYVYTYYGYPFLMNVSQNQALRVLMQNIMAHVLIFFGSKCWDDPRMDQDKEWKENCTLESDRRYQ